MSVKGVLGAAAGCHHANKHARQQQQQQETTQSYRPNRRQGGIMLTPAVWHSRYKAPRLGKRRWVAGRRGTSGAMRRRQI